MKHGHVTGHKRERQAATPHFDAIQAAHLARIEREWATKQATSTTTTTTQAA